MLLWLLLMAYCGLRACEIALLRGECVRLRADPPYILVAEGATKSSTEERIVEVPDFLAAELRAARLPARGWCWPRLDGRPGPNQPWHVSHLVNEFLAPWGVTGHQLRHWYASALHDETGDIRLVQAKLGHGSLDVTMVYTRAKGGKGAAEQVNKLPKPRRLRAV
jgi:integrase